MATTRDGTPSEELPTAPVARAADAPTIEDAPTWTEASSRYETRTIIGAGAMGVVRVCLDRRIGREVAMKVLKPEHDSDASAQLRFEREARVQGQLEHPAIVPVHELGTAPDGAAFFTMKRVQGESLRAILRGLAKRDPAYVEKYTTRRLLGAFATVCLAVAFAHARGVLHRDIKPSNIMLGDFGEVYLLDWGIAKVRSPEHLPADLTLEARAIAVPVSLGDATSLGDTVGTLGYMPPEQLRGDAVDERADVYALGATLFEILTLTPLHPRDRDEATASTMRDADARPSLRAPDRRVPKALERLCVRATAVDRAARPSSAREMAEIIEAVLDGDRDAERRKKHARQLAARARAAAARALAGEPETQAARESAIEDAHRAVALDPSNPEAVEVLVALARASPRQVDGDEADEAIAVGTNRVRRVLARTGALLFIPWIAGIVFALTLGARSPLPIVAALASAVLSLALAAYRARVTSSRATLAAIVATNLTAALTTFAFGPFLIVPGLLGCNALAFTIASMPSSLIKDGGAESRVLRVAAIALAIAGFVVPVALELFGVLPPSFALRDGALVILPRVLEYPPRITVAILVLVNVCLIVAPAIIALRVRDAALGAERRVLANATRMRRLLPREARDAVRSPAEELASRDTGL